MRPGRLPVAASSFETVRFAALLRMRNFGEAKGDSPRAYALRDDASLSL
jgi:hypothetical protein